MDKKYMKAAIELAKKGYGKVAPNPMVGCVIVKNNRIIAKGWHKCFGSKHAEIDALCKAGKNAQGADLYVTLEPCNTFGKQPPCSDSIVKAGIKRVFYAVKDPNARGSRQFLVKHGVEVHSGVLSNEAKLLIKEHIEHIKIKNRVSIKAAMTLDGKIATQNYDSKWITCQKSRDFVHRLRTQYDAVLIGSNTALKDNPFLTSHSKGRNPIRVVIDSNLSIPKNSNLLKNFSPTIIFYDEAIKNTAGHFRKEHIILAPINIKKAKNNFNIIIDKLNVFGIKTILVEGGGEIISSALFSKRVGDIYFFVAPKIIGGKNSISAVGAKGAATIAKALKVQNMTFEKIGQDFLIRGTL
ncbi:MAG: bifunctional diaminohydroxyphosphoribosylaminopyrimidine deaminase/5-amino-6-(5-phosphoribosylamino)uracil reductase RibD [Elusimicrobiota bacterium]|jgi:diaminohydroxyphosphoribosylaminopyrimidine deaminase/5-amino-6-(5-phosphoribosylamino)uracil reductase|nr:bifunctional diaminohydroxyphosphoribosylaminopyrimidine deaminase/5-amino-6-(5-phosphoribosylamino)uracil reductase RibD [Elusimicrobiota bacterium]